jgi:hypothetical protein
MESDRNVHELDGGELEVFCYDNLYGKGKYTETIKQIDGENEERVLMQRFNYQTGERVLWIIYGSRLDNPVFNDHKTKLVESGKWKGEVAKKRRA